MEYPRPSEVPPIRLAHDKFWAFAKWFKPMKASIHKKNNSFFMKICFKVIRFIICLFAFGANVFIQSYFMNKAPTICCSNNVIFYFTPKIKTFIQTNNIFFRINPQFSFWLLREKIFVIMCVEEIIETKHYCQKPYVFTKNHVHLLTQNGVDFE
jgi:hypothetical protein